MSNKENVEDKILMLKYNYNFELVLKVRRNRLFTIIYNNRKIHNLIGYDKTVKYLDDLDEYFKVYKLKVDKNGIIK